jgi:archaemetzincin
MGAIPASVMDAIGEGLLSAYGFETSILEEVPLPIDAFNLDRQQHLSVLVIQEIVRMGLDAMVLGIADEDLYAQGLQFIFGEADYEKTVKEAVHEVGHLIGLPHCPNPQCVMRYSNTLTHTDRKSVELCKVCRKRPGLMGA